MVARSPAGAPGAALEQGLASSDPALRLRAVRELKNSVIGNRFKKLQCLPLVPRLLDVLASGSGGGGGGDPELLVQAAAAVGSLAFGIDDGVRAVVSGGGVAALVAALTSENERVVVAAARALKQVYQSPLAPREPLLEEPVLRRLVWLLQQPPQANVAEAAASVLGQCCTGASEANSVVAAGAVPALTVLLGSPRRSCQEAAVECLAAATQHSQQACRQLLGAPAGAATHQPAAAAAKQEQGAAGAAEPPQQQQQQQQCVLDKLLCLMKQQDNRMRFQCARCISHISRAVDPEDRGVNERLMPACRSTLPHLVRLLAATEAAAAALAGSDGGAPAGLAAAAGAGGAPAAPAGAEGAAGGGSPLFLYEVPLVLAQLIQERPELLQLALELDTVKALLRLLHSKLATAPAPPPTPPPAEADGADSAPGSGGSGSGRAPAGAARAAAAARRARAASAAVAAVALRRGCLLALGALAMQGDAARQAMVDGRLVGAVVAALGDSHAEVCAAGAHCLRGLSRSVRLLRGGAISAGVAPPLVALLQDSSASEVQAAAAGAACNLLLGFSSVRQPLLKAGVVAALAPLASSMLPDLRLHAVWAFRNLAHECEPATQAELLAALPWASFRQLLVADDDARVREQAVRLLQNLAKGGASTEQLLSWSGGGLLPLLEERLDPSHYAQLLPAVASAAAAAAAAAAADGGASAPPPPQQQLLLLLPPQPPPQQQQQQAPCGAAGDSPAQLRAQLVALLYTAANLCSGYETHKALVMGSRVPTLLLQHMRIGSDGLPAPAGGARVGPSSGGGGGGGGASAAAAAAAAEDCMFDVCLAAVWCIINLLWCDAPGDAPEPADTDAAAEQQEQQEQQQERQQQQAAIAARAHALRELGVEVVLRGVLARNRRSAGARPGAAGAAAGAASPRGQAAAAASPRGAAPLPPPLADQGSQDLAERVQTALEQLGAK